MKKLYLASGIVLAIVAAFSLLTVTGILALASTQSLSVITPQGTMGIALTTSNKNYIYPLASTGKGYTYKWQMIAKNTGTLAWDGSEITMRVGVSGTIAVASSVPGIAGSYQVEKCGAGTDVVACREDILTGWNLQYYIGSCLTPGTWLPGDTAPNRMSGVTLGALPALTSKTICFKLTVPATTTDGNHVLISNLLAYASGTYAVASQVDNLAVGGISGDLTMAIVGLLSILGSAGAFVFGVKP